MAICDSDAEDQAALRIVLDLFPAMANGEFELTSRPTNDYNCIAFALGEDDCRWWPAPSTIMQPNATYWPRRIPCEESITAFKKAFELKGYSICADSHLEVGLEKIALYCNSSGIPTHAARQITSGPHSGQWQSKIGKEADIRHETLAALEGVEYGKVHSYFARKLAS